MKMHRTEVVATARKFVAEEFKGYREVDIDSDYMQVYDCTIIKLYLVNRHHHIFKVSFIVETDMTIEYDGRFICLD